MRAPPVVAGDSLRRGAALAALAAALLGAAGCAPIEKEYRPDFGRSYRLPQKGTDIPVLAKVPILKRLVRVEAQRAVDASGDLSLSELRIFARREVNLTRVGGLPRDDLQSLARILGIPEEGMAPEELAREIMARLQAVFQDEPLARLPARVLFLEVGTGLWGRLVSERRLEDPKEWSGLVAGWDNLGDPGKEVRQDFQKLRGLAARFRAGVLVLAEYDWAVQSFGGRRLLCGRYQAAVADVESGLILDVLESARQEDLQSDWEVNVNAQREAQADALACDLYRRLAATLQRELKPAGKP